MLRSLIYTSALLLASILSTPFALAQGADNDGLILEAENISRDYATKTVTLKGHVHIGYENDHIRCDSATLDLQKQEVVAEGNVSLENEGTYIEGVRIQYNYKTKVGEIQKGYVQDGPVVFSGELIKKLSDKKYFAKKAQYTSCKTCPAAWSFSGSEIDAEMGGYANIKYPILRIANLPILFLPRLFVPLKTDRQSGVLTPSLEQSSKGGTAISLPYFWAISKDKDLTNTLKNYERRGLKHLAEFRYVINNESKGTLNAAFLQDEAFTDNEKIQSTEKSFNRAFMTYQHYYALPDNFIHRMDLNIVSDLRYPRDFSDEIAGHGDSALENKMSITKNMERQSFNIEADYYTNLLKNEAIADNSDAVHRAPEINYSLMETDLFNSNVFFKFDFNYTNFARRDFAYDDVDSAPSSISSRNEPVYRRDGAFDYSGTQRDQIRTGHRYIFQPSVSYPFHVGHYLDVLPSLTYNETQYRFNVEPASPVDNYSRNAERRYVQADISFKTKYSAVYASGDSPTSNRYKHEIEPEIIYSRIPYSEKTNHIFFGNYEDQPYSRHTEAISNNDFEGSSGIQFDYRDRLFDKNIASFVLSNYLIRKTYTEDALPSYQKFVTLRLSQSYDFNAAQRPNPRPWSNLNGLLDVRQKSFETHTTADYYPYAQITNWSTRIKFISVYSNYLEVTYSNNLIVDEDDQVHKDQQTETLGAGVGFRSHYFDLLGRGNFSLITDQLDSWEYVAVAKPPGDCWSLKFSHKKMLGSDSLTKYSVNFEFSGI